MIMIKSTKLLYTSLVLLILGFGVYIFYSTAFREFHPVIDKQPKLEYPAIRNQERIDATIIEVKNNISTISVSFASIEQNTIVKFFDPDKLFNIPIIAYITPRGKIVTAISMSENCTSKEFYLENNNIHCANCPSYWNMESLEAYACCQRYYPDPIPSKLVNGEIIIEKSVFANWQKRD